ncbi:MAG: hypothetical protein Q8O83_04170 [bacterium]|nr:hypothetical protein [bacterium]
MDILSLWFIPVIIRVVIIDTFGPWLRKAKIINTNNVSFRKRFALHYFFAFMLALGAATITQSSIVSLTTMIIFLVGIFNGYGAFCQWRADQFALSTGALFAFTDDFIAMTLGYMILHEAKFLNPGLGAGLALCISAAILFAVYNYYQKKNKKEHLPFAFFRNVLSYTIIWGFATFLMRYFALEKISIGTFVFGWYGGAFFTAIVIFSLYAFGIIRDKEEGQKRNANEHPVLSRKKTIGMTFLAGALIFLNIVCTYWAFSLAPLTVIKPLFFVSLMVMPALVGLIYFKEYDRFKGFQKMFFLQAVAGGVLIALSFHS